MGRAAAGYRLTELGSRRNRAAKRRRLARLRQRSWHLRIDLLDRDGSERPSHIACTRGRRRRSRNLEIKPPRRWPPTSAPRSTTFWRTAFNARSRPFRLRLLHSPHQPAPGWEGDATRSLRSNREFGSTIWSCHCRCARMAGNLWRSTFGQTSSARTATSRAIAFCSRGPPATARHPLPKASQKPWLFRSSLSAMTRSSAAISARPTPVYASYSTTSGRSPASSSSTNSTPSAKNAVTRTRPAKSSVWCPSC